MTYRRLDDDKKTIPVVIDVNGVIFEATKTVFPALPIDSYFDREVILDDDL